MAQKKGSALRHYWFAMALTLAALAMVVFETGPSGLWPVAILAIIEITFSFDNAVINSEVLGRMSRAWRVVFLTAGIAIAVFGVRLVLPLLLVSLTSHASMGSVLDMALHHPEQYAEHLHEGYPVIAAFGAVFLLMIGLRFLAEQRETKWIPVIEHNIARHEQPWLIPVGGAIVAILAMVTLITPGDSRVVVAGALGAVTFLVIKGLSQFIESRHGNDQGSSHNWVNFLYLEILDASFSFDGVIAAFAITKDVLLIASGLGIGALYVRSITVHLLERGTLNEYRYLVHGAHYAIVLLGVILVLSMRVELPEWLTGLLGVGVIAWAFYSSVKHNKQVAAGQL